MGCQVLMTLNHGAITETFKTYLMAPFFLAAEILQLAELHLAVLGRLSQTFKEWTME